MKPKLLIFHLARIPSYLLLLIAIIDIFHLYPESPRSTPPPVTPIVRMVEMEPAFTTLSNPTPFRPLSPAPALDESDRWTLYSGINVMIQSQRGETPIQMPMPQVERPYRGTSLPIRG